MWVTHSFVVIVADVHKLYILLCAKKNMYKHMWVHPRARIIPPSHTKVITSGTSSSYSHQRRFPKYQQYHGKICVCVMCVCVFVI